MKIVYIIFLIALAYFLFAFVILRFLIPFMGLKKYVLPKDLPQELKETVLSLENQSVDQRFFLEAVYKFILRGWNHGRFGVLLHFPKLFRSDINEIWSDKSFAHCNHLNFLAYGILANSKFFKEDDIILKYVPLNFVLHQYLKVRINGEWVDFDPAGAGIRGKPVGTHQSFFG
jgi:hypothetical protein